MNFMADGLFFVGRPDDVARYASDGGFTVPTAAFPGS
jgi:hypothetical protein